ncbi:MAG: hypothetical protein LBJ69_00490 [Holosporales bacterium]|nr:hypothetical protein [Holosporales bacterium]
MYQRDKWSVGDSLTEDEARILTSGRGEEAASVVLECQVGKEVQVTNADTGHTMVLVRIYNVDGDRIMNILYQPSRGTPIVRGNPLTVDQGHHNSAYHLFVNAPENEGEHNKHREILHEAVRAAQEGREFVLPVTITISPSSEPAE